MMALLNASMNLPHTQCLSLTILRRDRPFNTIFVQHQSSRYDAFGGKTGTTGTVTNQYLFAGEQYDANLGDYYLEHATMTWIVGDLLNEMILKESLVILCHYISTVM